ncbi:MAG: hypothetical protein OXG81_16870 [Acidobacteria bacterium]|nr:hypothetical protein [Acidobacteriota bacterium]
MRADHDVARTFTDRGDQVLPAFSRLPLCCGSRKLLDRRFEPALLEHAKQFVAAIHRLAADDPTQIVEQAGQRALPWFRGERRALRARAGDAGTRQRHASAQRGACQPALVGGVAAGVHCAREILPFRGRQASSPTITSTWSWGA